MGSDSGSPPDERLVRTALGGDRRAFDTLIERHFGTVYAIALARLRDPEMAEDLAQEVFLRVHLNLGQFDPRHRFGAWVARIARNLAIDWLRRGQRASRLLPMVPLDAVAGGVSDTEAKGARETMASQEETQAVRRAIMGLAAEQREVVLLHFSEELTQHQIAERLGVHQATVSRQIQRALKSLRGTLEPVLREAAPTLRAPRAAVAKSLLIASAVGAMSATVKTTLAASASVGQWASVAETAKAGAVGAVGFIGFLKSLPALIAGGMKIMATGKGITATAGVIAVIAFGAQHVMKGASQPEATSAPQEELQAPAPAQTRSQSAVPLPDHPGVFAFDESGALTELVPIENGRLGQIMGQFQGGADPLALVSGLTPNTMPRSARLMVQMPVDQLSPYFLVQQISLAEVTQMAPTMDRNQRGASMPFSRTVPHELHEIPGHTGLAELVLRESLTGDLLVLAYQISGREVVSFARLTGTMPVSVDLTTP